MKHDFQDLPLPIRKALPVHPNPALVRDLHRDTLGIRSARYLLAQLQAYTEALRALDARSNPKHTAIKEKLESCCRNTPCRKPYCPICTYEKILRTEERFAQVLDPYPDEELFMLTIIFGACARVDEVEILCRDFKDRFTQFAKDWTKETGYSLPYVGQIEVDILPAGLVTGDTCPNTFKCLSSLDPGLIQQLASRDNLLLKPHAHIWVACPDRKRLDARLRTYGTRRHNNCTPHWPAPFQIDIRGAIQGQTRRERIKRSACYLHKYVKPNAPIPYHIAQDVILLDITLQDELHSSLFQVGRPASFKCLRGTSVSGMFIQ